MTHTEIAPAKLNLLLEVGHAREDGMHEICSLFASVELADELEFDLESGSSSASDTIECPGIAGENLVAKAIAEFRADAQARGAEPLAPLAVRIEKRIPVAAGLGGGSADAAAALRAANEFAGGPFDADGLRGIAERVGADVPSQVEPRHALVEGVGERVEPIELPAAEVVLAPDPDGLATAEVYAEADRIQATRATLDPEGARALAARALPDLADGLHNDLEAAALSLRPDLAERIAAVRAAGALHAAVTGSGPTVYGLFADASAAERAAEQIPGSVRTTLRA